MLTSFLCFHLSWINKQFIIFTLSECFSGRAAFLLTINSQDGIRAAGDYPNARQGVFMGKKDLKKADVRNGVLPLLVLLLPAFITIRWLRLLLQS